MVYHRQGHPDDARQELERALARLKAEPPPTWMAQVEADALRRQAEATLRTPTER
jgi:hypothetical protein